MGTKVPTGPCLGRQVVPLASLQDVFAIGSGDPEVLIGDRASHRLDLYGRGVQQCRYGAGHVFDGQARTSDLGGFGDGSSFGSGEYDPCVPRMFDPRLNFVLLAERERYRQTRDLGLNFLGLTSHTATVPLESIIQ